MRQVHIVITGLVQGVFFRASTRDKALEIGISGDVKNLRGGGVEIYAQGSDKQIKEFVEWCWQGPPGARVEDVRLSNVSLEVTPESFQIVY